MFLLNALIVCSLIRLTPGQPTYSDNGSSVYDRRLAAVEVSLEAMRNNVAGLQSAVSAISDAIGIRCPSGFTPTSHGYCFKVVSAKTTWQTAGQRCKTLNAKAHLAVIDSAVEQTDMETIARNDAALNASCWLDSTFGMSFWIGAQRIDPSSNSTFVWRTLKADGTEDYMRSMTYKNWRHDEPNYAGNNEACSCIHSELPWGYRWNDFQCGTPLCAVCETDMY